MILVDISDERFWNILFDEAYVEGQQAERIENELKKIIAYDQEEVVKRMEELIDKADENRKSALSKLDYISVNNEHGRMSDFKDAIEIVRRGGVK